ncbi:hypothetical protein [Bizionia myxarmorum]|uniref:hypothetical protein n=1 Tax=Bizionia myxarmorum TaxID=291186 RepID=UPI001478A126|nr:hypothetical protein [Bizionia myxarmorum]
MSTKTTKKQPTEAKYVKNFVGNDEAKAKGMASEKLGVPTKLLSNHHTDKMYVFRKR